MSAQSTSRLLLVAPTAFCSNAETAADNAFMETATADVQATIAAAAAEHAGLVSMLGALGCSLTLVERTPAHTPDACFPNNLFSTHAGGVLVRYPMRAPSRRAEWSALADALRGAGVDVDAAVCVGDAALDAGHDALEGTGSLVLDRVHGVAYMCVSQRSQLALAEATIVVRRSLPDIRRLIAFHATDARSHIVYHTNVIMAIGTRWAVACLDAIDALEERRAVRDALAACDERVLVEISREQVHEFCGNILEVRNARGQCALVMSMRAYKAFVPHQMAALEAACDGGVHACVLDTIERVGGGGVRCCIAELFV